MSANVQTFGTLLCAIELIMSESVLHVNAENRPTKYRLTDDTCTDSDARKEVFLHTSCHNHHVSVPSRRAAESTSYDHV